MWCKASKKEKRRRNWFWRRNRKRLDRERRQSAYRRIRRVWFFAQPLILLVLLALLGWMGVRWLQTTSTLALKEVRFLEQPHLSKAEMMAVAGLRYGMNLLSFDLARGLRRLQAHPWVRSARIWRELPHRISVEVKERRPVALVRLRHLYYLDASGLPFARVWKKKKPAYPLLVGFRRSRYKQQPQQIQKRLRQALQILRCYRKLGLQRYKKVREVQVDPVFGVTLLAQSTRIHLGTNRYEERLQRLVRLLRLLRQRGVQEIRYVYLDNNRHPERISVGLKGQVPVASDAIGAPPPARKRKP